jgi:dihydrofolate synthase/folylpolyglutamate synthase
MRTYSETLDYLYEQLPMFHRIGAAAYKADLDNTHRIAELLDHPENKFRSVHIAGTNGKGSTSHMIASVLQSAGYKTGLYTSPHLKDFRERIRINGFKISEQTVVDFVNQYSKEFEKIKPSFFEWTVGLAFDYFANQKVDIAIIETGLGGRLDSTNIITPLVSVITNIGLDHTQLLGDTLKKIAAEKAGIIKQGVPVVIGEYNDDTARVFIERARETSSEMFFADEFLSVMKNPPYNGLANYTIYEEKELLYDFLQLDLEGNYQLKNVLTAVQTLQLLKKSGISLLDRYIREGLNKVKSQTGLMGRWQTISKSPLTICDVGHNEDGIREVVQQLEGTPHKRLHIVFGAVNDKDITAMLRLLPKDADYYFCRADIPRAMDATELAKKAAEAGLKGKSFFTVAEALHAAQNAAGNDDLIFIGGSTFVVAEVL